MYSRISSNHCTSDPGAPTVSAKFCRVVWILCVVDSNNSMARELRAADGVSSRTGALVEHHVSQRPAARSNAGTPQASR